MIVSCGEALVDLVPDPVPGGGPMNVAVAASRLDVPAAFVGRVSTDDYGDQIWSYLESNNVDLRAAERGDEPTARAIIEHKPELHFRFEGDDTADTKMTSVDLAPLGPGPHLLHGGTLALFRGETAETLATLASSYPGIVSLDPNVRPSFIDDRSRWQHFHQRWLDNTAIYKVSDEDLNWIWGDRDVDSVAAELINGGVIVVLVTKGSHGADIYTADGSVHVDGHHVHVVDTVGAGDTFIATVLASLWDAEITDRDSLAYLNLDAWHEIGWRATTAAAITCSRKGADTPSKAEVEKLVEKR